MITYFFFPMIYMERSLHNETKTVTNNMIIENDLKFLMYASLRFTISLPCFKGIWNISSLRDSVTYQVQLGNIVSF